MPELGPVVTVDEYQHARTCCTRGEWRTDSGRRFPDVGMGDFWAGLHRLGVERRDDPYRVGVDLTPELATLWPLPAEMQLELEQVDALPFGPPSLDDRTEVEVEVEVDEMVAAAGRWGSTSAGTRPCADCFYLKLCGDQLCVNSAWTVQCSEPAPGNHAVHLSIGTGNRDVQDDWLRATGLSLGPAQTGW